MVFVVIDGQVAGLLGISNQVKETTPEAIRALHKEGVRIVMLNGDNKITAKAVARKVVFPFGVLAQPKRNS